MNTTCSFELDLTDREVSAFSELSGDRNPLHVDAAYARTTEFGRPIAHGALLVALVSRVLGMHIPGERSLLLSMSVRFPKPLFYPSRIRVDGRLKSFDNERMVGVVQVIITNVTKGWAVLEAEAQVAWHDIVNGAPGKADTAPKAHAEAAPPASAHTSAGTRARVLITGGTGGLGAGLLPLLRAQYDLACVSRQQRAGGSSDGLRFACVDLESPGELERYLDQESPQDVYGIVHLSVPPVPRAFVSDDLDAVRRHLRHGVEIPLLLARWARRPGSGVKRLIFIGSTAGSKFPQPHMGAYALGKAALEYLPRLLTADLMAQGATVNVVSPTAIPVGINEGMSHRAQAVLMGKMPTRRLVEPRDVAQVVLFLLSEAAAQVNGTVIAVDGGLSES